MRMVSVPTEVKTASKEATNLASRSRMRNRKRLPLSSSAAVKLRATWVAHAPLGLAVTPRRCTTRLCTSTTKSA
jgi:hypothetical protein